MKIPGHERVLFMREYQHSGHHHNEGDEDDGDDYCAQSQVEHGRVKTWLMSFLSSLADTHPIHKR